MGPSPVDIPDCTAPNKKRQLCRLHACGTIPRIKTTKSELLTGRGINSATTKQNSNKLGYPFYLASCTNFVCA